MGVEPTGNTECPPTELKSAKPTGTYPPPLKTAYINSKIIARGLNGEYSDE